ncbi:(2Fe-2S)-binding protein [Paraburkholderia sp. J63]|uniref:(2Fe-2S)-binding protein n=1 Tax=Paraburkholderia sp. J63 TaxID=2805434 RepID=UPI002ABDDDBD|nr:(2Fe-2S)-binding protein [Paraburkholderia sp. J63]
METPMWSINVNGRDFRVSAAPEMPLLWVLRELLRLRGAKFGCGKAQCGACTVHLEGAAVRSCVLPIAAVVGKRVQTIEGLESEQLRALQQAWVEHQAPQCGYCQPGQLMSAAALLAGNAHPSDADIDAAMSGNLCRCGTYTRIRAAIHEAAAGLAHNAKGAAR